VAPLPNSQTFLLHSKPGSQRTIYIDFDGATVSNTLWNRAESQGGLGLANGTYGGFSLDANAASFNDAELATIQTVWQRVAEDYAPFDVDVTTEAPPAAAIDRAGASDQIYGTVALVTGSVDAHAQLCGDPSCTGIAFVDVFDEPNSHSLYQPAWAFSAYFDDVLSMAETVSHEVGHNFGLRHDGEGSVDYYGGQGPWAPIMGSSVKPIIQWSKGDYANANNAEDDLALIAANGAPVRDDEAGNTVPAAAAVLPTTPAFISTREDVDVYALGTCAGPISVTGATAYASPNLDIQLKLLDGAGNQLAIANPVSAEVSENEASGMGATVSYTAAGAPVYVAIDGVGNGSAATGYDDYGSLGSYLLSRTGNCGSGSTTAPGAPAVSAAATGKTSVTVTWTAPATDGGSPITGYVVTRAGQTPVEVSAATTSQAFTGLAPGTVYSFTVAARNAVGTGAAGSASATTRDVPSAVAPGAPGIGKARPGRSGGAKTAIIRWVAPADGGAAITGYTIYAHKMRRTTVIRTKRYSVSASFRAANLPVGDGSWAFRVRARNSVGRGAFSAYSSTVAAR